MKQDFISIQGTILDYNEYVKEIILLKNYLKNKIREFLFKEDFVLEKNNNHTYHQTKLSFYNKEKGIEVEINIKKKNKEVFV